MLDVYTDYPLIKFGDIAGQPAPIRKGRLVCYDGNKYCKVIVNEKEFEIKSGYLYREETMKTQLRHKDLGAFHKNAKKTQEKGGNTETMYNLYWRPVSKDLFVYRFWTHVRWDNNMKYSDDYKEGFATQDDIDSWQTHLPFQPKPSGNHDYWMLVKNEFVDLYRQWGFPGAICFNQKEMFSYEKMDELICKTPFSVLQDTKQKEYTIVSCRNYDHKLFLLNGTQVEKPVHFHYSPSEGSIHNINYDLEKVLNVLVKRKDIVFLDSERISFDESYAVIQNIPHYNCYEGQDRTLHFLWRPSKKDFLKFNKEEAMFGDVNKIKELDLLGIEKFGKGNLNVKGKNSKHS